MQTASHVLDRVLVLEMVRVTEAAAIAASKLVGRGNERDADQAAVEAMREALNQLEFDGTIVIGEGERDKAPMLYIGEKVGTVREGVPCIDIALDPLEGTTITAKAGPNAMAVLASPDMARIDLAGQAAAPSARARAFWSRNRGLVFTATNLPPLQAGRVYQIWVLTKGAPISAGLVSPDDLGGTTAVLGTAPDIPQPAGVAVSLEPAGGVPAPTGAIYLAGTVV